MPEKVLVSTEEISNAIQQYTSAKETKLSAINAMKSAVDTLDGTWDGPASTVFMGAFKALHANLMTSEQIMTDAIDELQKVIEESIDVEDKVKAAAEALDAGNPLGV